MFCPNCGKQVSEPAKFCKECGCNLNFEEPKPVQPNASGAAGKCSRHPQLDAIGVCAECGNGVCVLCKSGIKGKLYCPTCFNKVINKPATVSDSLVKEGLTAESSNQANMVTAPVKAEDRIKFKRDTASKQKRFKRFRERPNLTIFLAGLLVYVPSVVVGLLLNYYQPRRSYWLILIVIFIAFLLPMICLGIMSWACKQKGRSIFWGLVVIIPFISGVVLEFFPSLYDWFFLVDAISFIGWIILMCLPYSVLLFFSNILTEEQTASGLYLEKVGKVLYLKRENEDEVLATFLPKITLPDYIREEAQKFVKPSS